jgi:hypothetical protein
VAKSAFRIASTDWSGSAGFGTNNPPIPEGSPLKDKATVSVNESVPVMERLLVMVVFGKISQVLVIGIIPKSGRARVKVMGIFTEKLLFVTVIVLVGLAVTVSVNK